MIAFHEDHPALRFWEQDGAYHLDVREYLRQGGRPYSLLLGCVRQMAPGDSFVVHSLFDPQPLRRQFARMGLLQELTQLEPEHWCLTVRLDAARPEPMVPEPAGP
jgi:hypothetical protein